jgi:predicted metal-dependent hydrolase
MANKAKETESFPFSNWTVEVHRRAFRRSVSIYLYPRKPIKVVASKLTTQKVIYEFLLSKKDWIEKHFHKFNELAEKFPEKRIRSYEKFPFQGRNLALKMVVTVLKKPFVAIQNEELRLHIPHDNWNADVLTDEHPQLLAVVRDFYKREAIKTITERTNHWAGQMNLFPHSLKFREQKTRWGSCSSKGAINFNWRLIVFKPEIVDYVIIHELAHLKHLNHSPKFWNLVEQHCSNYEVLMKDLRESQYICEFLTVRS